MGGDPLEVRGYITDTRYANIIEAQEGMSMLDIECKVNRFLSEIGETGRLMVDYIEGTFKDNQSQTKIDRFAALERGLLRRQQSGL